MRREFPNITQVTPELLESQLARRASLYTDLQDALDVARHRLISALKDAAQGGISEERMVEVSGLRPERVHQVVKSFADPRSVRV